MPSADAVWDFPPKTHWKSEWSGTIEIQDDGASASTIGPVLAWVPYGLVGALLVLTRLRSLPFGGWLNAWTISWPEIFGSSITANVQPLFLPGTVFIVVSLTTFFLHRVATDEVLGALSSGRVETQRHEVELALHVVPQPLAEGGAVVEAVRLEPAGNCFLVVSGERHSGEAADLLGVEDAHPHRATAALAAAESTVASAEPAAYAEVSRKLDRELLERRALYLGDVWLRRESNSARKRI